MSNLTGRGIINPITAQEPEPLTRSEISRRNRKEGIKRQRQAAKVMQVKPKFRNSLGNEESWNEPREIPGTRWEVKSGRMPALLKRAFEQVENTRSLGSLWRSGVLFVDESEATYAILRAEDLVQLCRGLAEVGHAGEIKNLSRQARRLLERLEALA